MLEIHAGRVVRNQTGCGLQPPKLAHPEELMLHPEAEALTGMPHCWLH